MTRQKWCIVQRISAEEFTNSEESKGLKKTDPVMFAQKMRLIPSVDDLAKNANVNWWSPDQKNHKLFKKGGFENFRGRVRIDDVIFNYIIRSGKAKFGDVFYDINLEVDQILPRTNNASGIKKSTSSNSISKTGENATKRLSLSENVKAAEEYFGITYKINEAGYLLTDGKLLDFSGRHEGAQGGYRTVDHRDIIDALGEEYGGDTYTGGMIRFMQEGNIRLSPESGGINLSVKPSKAQLDTLDRYITNFRGEVTLDIDDEHGNTVVSMEYPMRTYSKRIINDIVDYFDKGVIPEQPSTLGQFRYSLDIETYLSSSEQGLFWNKIGERKNGTQFPKSRNGDSILTIGNKLVYTGRGYQNPKVNRIVEVIVTEDSEYETTYTSFIQEDIIEYERNEKNKREFETFTDFIKENYRTLFGKRVDILLHEGQTSRTIQKNGTNEQSSTRRKTYYNFENEQERSRDTGKSRESSTLRYSLNDATDLSDFWFNNDNMEEPMLNDPTKMVYRSTV